MNHVVLQLSYLPSTTLSLLKGSILRKHIEEAHKGKGSKQRKYTEGRNHVEEMEVE
jgi:stalled ribosome alternative rescue factor ArfA